MSRSLVQVPRRVQEVADVESGMYRGSLAEDYDGIGQYVLVALSRTATTSAYKARVAAGDFGGGRVFPSGTPVLVSAQFGSLEVFLGNQPQVCELFNHATEPLFGGWGEGRYGPWLAAWNGLAELELPLPNVDDYVTYVDEGQAVLSYNPPTAQNDPVMGLKFPDGLEYPITAEFKFHVEDGTGAFSDPRSFNLYFGPQYFWDIDSWLVFFQTYDQAHEKTEFTTNSRDQAGFAWPIDTSDEKDYTENATQVLEPRIVKVMIDETGGYGKSWRESEVEPDDWEISAPWTGTPPPAPYYRFVYLENQSFNSPFTSGSTQPKFKVDYFCLNESPNARSNSSAVPVPLPGGPSGGAGGVGGSPGSVHDPGAGGTGSTGNQGATTSSAREITTDNQTIDSETFIGTYGEGVAIWAHGASAASPITNLTIKNCTIQNWEIGILAEHVLNIHFENCLIEDILYAGILTFSCIGGAILSNVMHRMGYQDTPDHDVNAYGIALSRVASGSLTADPRSANILVKDNTVEDVPTWEAYDTHSGQNIQFINNTSRRVLHPIVVGPDGDLFPALNVLVQGNHILEAKGRMFGLAHDANIAGITIRDLDQPSSVVDNEISTTYPIANHGRVYDYLGLSDATISGNVDVA